MADVKFEAKVSRAENCLCTACHKTDRVIKVRLPETLYHDGGFNLSTRYQDYWLCAQCRTNLAHALDWPTDEI